jgi:gluconolactonase
MCPTRTGLRSRMTTKKLYVAWTGKRPGDTGPGGKGDVHVLDVGSDNKLSKPVRVTFHRLICTIH